MSEPNQPISLTLIATVHGRFTDDPADDLSTPDAATVWLRGQGFGGVPDLVDDDVDGVIAFREAAFAILTALDAGDPVPTGAVDEVNSALARPHSAARLAIDPQRADALTLVRDDQRDSVDDVLHRCATDLAALTVGDAQGTVRQCVTHTCGTFFVDTSRAGNRKWCSSTTCGNRARVAAHRERVRDAASE